jgi:hypothetical protein
MTHIMGVCILCVGHEGVNCGSGVSERSTELVGRPRQGRCPARQHRPTPIHKKTYILFACNTRQVQYYRRKLAQFGVDQTKRRRFEKTPIALFVMIVIIIYDRTTQGRRLSFF